MNHIEFEKLDKNIYVYKNLLPNVEDMVEVLKNAENNPDSSYLFSDWHPWATFGTYVVTVYENKFFEYQDPKPELLIKEYNHYQTVLNAFYASTKHFMDDHNLIIGDNWERMGPSFSRYDAHDKTARPDDEVSMTHHTDYVKVERDMPGNKFALTCTMYLNDDYDRGGLSFLFGGKKLDYKPKAGEVIVFPSGHPDLLSDENIYYHAVDKVKNKDKYLIRCFYQIPFAGSPEWLANQIKYGPFKWMEMEKTRVEKNRLKSIEPEGMK